MTCSYTRYCASMRLKEGRCWARDPAFSDVQAYMTKRSVDIVPSDVLKPLNGLQACF